MMEANGKKVRLFKFTVFRFKKKNENKIKFLLRLGKIRVIKFKTN